MTTLSTNWVTEKHIDFEYKKYLLLGYLKEVSEQFESARLYPSLADLIRHYRNVLSIRDGKQFLSMQFPEQLKTADVVKLRMVYEKLVTDDEVMEEIGNIIHYSIPQFEKHIREGKEIYEFIESHLNIAPVGIVPLQIDEGYLLLRSAADTDTLVYEYHLTVFEGPDERYRGIHTQYLCSFPSTPLQTVENIKYELIRYRKELPNPATYVVESDMAFPLLESLLPIAKRTLVRHVCSQGGAC
ncbi:MAG: hypothetical protein ACKOKB_06070 [Bacteroidota bacterium]